MKNKCFSICIVIINIIGIICLIYYATLDISHSTYVVNPDAMLPMENWERAGMILTIGVIPMLIANTVGSLSVKKRNIIIRLLFFIPSIAEVFLVLHHWKIE